MTVYVSTPATLSDTETMELQKAALNDVLPQLGFIAQKLGIDPAVSLITNTYLIRASGSVYLLGEIFDIINWLTDCDALVMAPGYEKCELCQFELLIAHLMQKPVLCAGIEEAEDEPPDKPPLPGRLYNLAQAIERYVEESNAQKPIKKEDNRLV